MNKTPKSTVRNRINRAMPTGSFFDEIPLDEIFDAIKAQGGLPVQEDGTEWEGWLVGTCEGESNTGRATIPVVFENYSPMYLQIQWTGMPSGRWDVTFYVS